MVPQKNFPVKVATPLGKDVLFFDQMHVQASLGRLFHVELDLLSQNPDIKPEELLGQGVTVRYDPAGESPQYINGIVSHFSVTGAQNELDHKEEDYTGYHLTLQPWLWLLTRTTDCRIFQDKTVPDIVKEVFRSQGFSDFKDLMSGSYRQWSYCVQYRESDFNFVSRLLEQEGIYYYFTHEDGKHTLVLADAYSSHKANSGYEKVPYAVHETGIFAGIFEKGHISSFSVNHQVQPGSYALNEFNFTKPKASLQTTSAIKRAHDQSTYEVYDYPGEYGKMSEGDQYARTRIEEIHAQYEQAQAQTSAYGMTLGSLFHLTKFPTERYNREYLITSSAHQLTGGSTLSGEGGGGADHQVSFTALEAKTPYRPERSTAKPEISGPQTAIVVGLAGEEIYTDEYGRVKLQFHWDRYGKSDENSSCWVRVSQIWAGSNWGAMHIPRIGQEVIVEFLEGDPDRPIITGRVYNKDNMPPYDLSANKTQSGIKSRSSKGGVGNNFNELRFEDSKGQEELYIQAEKDSTNLVKNNHSQTVGNHKNVSVGADYSQTVTAELWNKAKRVVITADTEIFLEVGGNFISISKSGINIEGTLVNINCGNAPSSKAPPAGFSHKK